MSIKSLISNICGLLQRLFTGTLNLYAQLCEFSFKKPKVFSISDSFKQPRELGELGKENLISFNLTLTEVFIVFSARNWWAGMPDRKANLKVSVSHRSLRLSQNIQHS